MERAFSSGPSPLGLASPSSWESYRKPCAFPECPVPGTLPAATRALMLLLLADLPRGRWCRLTVHLGELRFWEVKWPVQVHTAGRTRGRPRASAFRLKPMSISMMLPQSVNSAVTLNSELETVLVLCRRG